MQRRAALARALLVEPEFLMLDEPLISLDSALAERMRHLLNDYWREQRTTTLLVTHNLAEAAELSTRILILSPSEGRLIADCALPPPDPRLRNDRAVSAVLEELRRMTQAWPRPDPPETHDTPGALSRVELAPTGSRLPCRSIIGTWYSRRMAVIWSLFSRISTGRSRASSGARRGARPWR